MRRGGQSQWCASRWALTYGEAGICMHQRGICEQPGGPLRAAMEARAWRHLHMWTCDASSAMRLKKFNLAAL